MASRRISITDPTYPAALRELAAPPSSLFVRGTLPAYAPQHGGMTLAENEPSASPASPGSPGSPGSPTPSTRITARVGVAIVGTRSASPEALRYTRSLAWSLSDAGVVVWSGGALGIDQAAHEGALAACGTTVLVAGSGLDVPYPPGAAGLFARIEKAGALVSIVADDQAPRRWIFLARNAVLAAMTRATVLVESPLKSGARNATAAARRLGRPTWIAAQPPWSPLAPTVREEVRLGARPLLHVDDLLASLALSPNDDSTSTVPTNDDGDRPGGHAAFSPAEPWSLLIPQATQATGSRPRSDGKRARSSTPQRPGPPASSRAVARMRQLSLIEAAVMRALDGSPRHPDDLCVALGLGAAEISVALMTLELDGMIENEGGRFHRCL